MGAEPSPPSATLVTTMQAPEATHRDIAGIFFLILKIISDSDQLSTESKKQVNLY